MPVSFKSYVPEVREKAAKATRTALDRMGDKAVEFAQNIVAVDTGNTKASLTHEPESNNVEIVGTSQSKAPYKDVYYAPFVELGTVKMRAQPFLRPAVEGNQDVYREVIEDAFREQF